MGACDKCCEVSTSALQCVRAANVFSTILLVKKVIKKKRKLGKVRTLIKLSIFVTENLLNVEDS